MKYIKTYEQSKGITFQEWLRRTHSQDLNITIIDCNNSNLIDLDGIEQFTNLKELICSNNKLTSLPDLPNALERLYCYNNKLKSLPDLPDTLEKLSCYNNKLTFLPDLPNTLKYLYCYNNELPYYNLESYWKWFEKTYPWKVAAKKYNL